ncbi:MAG TPA: hypothetical protein VLA92_03660 [Candidatus Saccharimonadales bacterium]|nr:hypothetical protein [Candidatus Saccharimonadales bacterium]
MSGEAFAPPQRTPDFTPVTGAFNPDYAKSLGAKREVWMPTDSESAEIRWSVTAHEGNEEYQIGDNNILYVERLAAAGMRNIFERFGIRSFYTRQRDTETYDTPVEIHEAALAFPSSAKHAQLLDEFAEGSQRVDRFRIRHCDGQYSGADLLNALNSNELLMSTAGEIEPRSDDGSGYYLSFYAHDLTVHFPAWLCLPKDISQRIRRQASDLLSEYRFAEKASGNERLERAMQNINEFGGLLDQTVNVWRMERLVSGDDLADTRAADEYNEDMSKILRYESNQYAQSTLHHIRDPREDQVLAARPTGW